MGSVQSLRRSAIVFIVFFSLLIRDLKPATERWLRRRSYLTFLSFFSTQEIIPFPKFLGIFFVSFLNLFHYPPPLFLPVFPVPLRAVSSAYGMSSFHSKEEEDCYCRSGIVLYGSICSRGGGSRKSVWGCEVLCEGWSGWAPFQSSSSCGVTSNSK